MSGDTLAQIDITQVILEATNNVCNKLLQSIDSEIYKQLDEVVFLKADLTEESFFVKIFGNSPTSGVLMLANCLLFAFILYYCIKLITSHFAGNEIESPSRFFLRAILAGILMNSSLEICSKILELTSQITDFFLDLGELTFNRGGISFQTLTSALQTTSNEDFTIFSIDGILTSMLSISSFALLLSFALRYILVEVLILASPFAFLCITNKSTEGFLKSWYRSLLSMLLLQIVIAVLLIIPHALLKENDTFFNKLLLVGSISALLKSGQLVKEFLGGIGITTNFQAGISGIKSMISR